MLVNIALCGLATRLARLLEIVINSHAGDSHKFHADTADKSDNPLITIIDADSQESLDAYQDLRRHHPNVIAVTISDHGAQGDTPYSIQRKSLFILIMRVLSELSERELACNKLSTDQSFPANPPQAATPVPTIPRVGNAIVAKAVTPAHPLAALVVDDSLTVREQMRMALERLGIACTQAESADAAMQLLQVNSYDLAFLDVVMPGTDGYELCRKIKHNSATRHMPILMLTSRSSPFDRARGALAGCDTYLTKPISWDTFSNAVDKALVKSSRHDHHPMMARGSSA